MSAAPPAYHGVLSSFMTYLHERNPPYDIHHNFTDEELNQIVPVDIVNYFNLRAYGTENPTEGDRPTETRSNSLKYWKKALSAFMPNRHMQWNNISSVGNPTRSTDVNDVIKRVKRAEVRKQGKPSQARRSCTKRE